MLNIEAIQNATELFKTVNARIESIADETEELTRKALTCPRCEIDQIVKQMMALANEHENLIPHWKALRFLMNSERIQGQ